MIDYAPSPSQTQPGDVKVRLKRGDWEIEITCSSDKVKAVIEDVLLESISRLNRRMSSLPK